MNKKILLFSIFVFTIISGYSQSATWAALPVFDSLEEYGNLYKVRDKGKVGLVDCAGKILINAQYDSITPFHEHLALALNLENGRYLVKGIINEQDYKLIELQEDYYMEFPAFTDGLLLVSDYYRKYGYLFPNGNLFKSCQYIKAYPFFGNLALVYKRNKEVAYLQTDGDELNTELEREGFSLRYGTTFNEESRAYIVANDGNNTKYCIINSLGNVVEKAKTTEGGRKAKNYKERGKFIFAAPINTFKKDPISVVKEGLLFGYVDEDNNTVLPVQFEKAEPFKNSYARVKKDGKYGIVKLSSGSFSGTFDTNILKVKNGKVNSILYSLTIPSEYYDKPLKMYMFDGTNEEKDFELIDLPNGNKGFSFVPILQNNESQKDYCLKLWADDNLFLWEDTQQLLIEYIKSYPPLLSVPKVLEGFVVDNEGFVRADSENKVGICAIVENPSSETLRLTVSFLIDGTQINKQELVIAPQSSNRIIEYINVKERISLKVSFKISTGLQKTETIKVKPFI